MYKCSKQECKHITKHLENLYSILLRLSVSIAMVFHRPRSMDQTESRLCRQGLYYGTGQTRGKHGHSIVTVCMYCKARVFVKGVIIPVLKQIFGALLSPLHPIPEQLEVCARKRKNAMAFHWVLTFNGQ